MNDRKRTGDGNDTGQILVRFKLTATLATPPTSAEDPPSSAAAQIVGYGRDAQYFGYVNKTITVWDSSRRHYGLSGESGWAIFHSESRRFEVIEMNGDLFRHGKVTTSPITAGGTGTVEIQYNDEGTETDSGVTVAVKDISDTEREVDDIVQMVYEPKSQRWYLVGGPASTSESGMQWVYVDASVVIDEGTPVAPFGSCLWSGKKLTIEPTAATFCSGEDRYSLTSNVWILTVDLLNGSGSSGPRLYKGDRYLAKLVGTYDIGGDIRPLYAVRKGAQHDIVRVSGVYPENNTGNNVTPNAAGLWNGEVLSVTVGAATFVGGATPYTASQQCWILAPDLPGGSVDVTARLKHGDRHPAILLGQFDFNGDVRPLYAIRMTTHFGWIRFKLNYSLAKTQGSQVVTVLEFWGTKTPADGPLTVWNLEKNVAGTYVFQGRANAVGYAVWDEKLARYRIVVLEDDEKNPAYGCRRCTGVSITGGVGAQDLSFSDVDGLVGMTNKTTVPNGLTIDREGHYLFGFHASVAWTAPSGTADGGQVVATLFRNGSAMSHDPLSNCSIISIGGAAIKGTLSITHINFMEVGDYVSVSMFGTSGDCAVTGGLTAVYLGPSDGPPTAGGSSLPPSPSARVPSGNDGGGEIPQQILNHYYGG